VIHNQDAQQEEAEEERPAEVVRGEPLPTPQEIQDEGRKIYVTKSGEKYHLSQGRKTLRGYRSYERKACEVCKERTQRTLTFNPNGRRPQSATELGFIHENEEYHDEGCTRLTSQRRKGKRPICKICEDEEFTLLWARNRQPAGRESRSS
jgi:hypothetical protein